MFKNRHTPDEPPIPATPGPGDHSGDQNVDETQALIEQLTTERDQAQKERDELKTKYLTTLADYQNSVKRAGPNEQEARRQGTTSVLHTLIPVLDHFDLALAQDTSKATAEQIASGVRAIQAELYKVLELNGVVLINPAPDTEFDPHRHEAIMQQCQDGINPGHIVRTFQIGYALGNRVIRPAKVCVAPANCELPSDG